MPHFFIKKEEINNESINLCDPETLRHIVLARRIKTGENLKFIDEDKIVYSTKVVSFDKKILKAQIISKEKSKRFLKYDIRLIQAVLSPDEQSQAISNATQTGVREIYPVISDNVSTKIKNLEKWQKIAHEAFKQCERADYPIIHEPRELFEVLGHFKKENILIFSEKDINITLDNAIKSLDKNSSIAVVVGPEGGFSKSEFEKFREYKLISLGNLIYRASNAVVAGVSNVVSRLEWLSKTSS